MELTIKINTEDNLDLEKIEKDCKDITISALKKAIDSIKQLETTIQKAIDTSKFQVGDYIRYKNRTDIVGRITAISDIFSQYNVETNVGKCCADIDFIEKWTPEKGDLCIFWDIHKAKSAGGIFDRMYNSEFMDSRNIDWKHCVPFINEAHFKEVVGYAV